MTIQLICIDCVNEFDFSDKQQKFFEAKGYKQPIRCKRCRELRKRERCSPYWGITEVMHQRLPARKGTGHQYYLRHV